MVDDKIPKNCDEGERTVRSRRAHGQRSSGALVQTVAYQLKDTRSAKTLMVNLRHGLDEVVALVT